MCLSFILILIGIRTHVYKFINGEGCLDGDYFDNFENKISNKFEKNDKILKIEH
jgi:hypothetical protein